MTVDVLFALLIPFLGTCLGAACVFFMKGELPQNVQRILTGFAAGVMIAASIWSLIIPAMENSAELEKWAFVPVVVGFWIGTIFLLTLDKIIPHMHLNSTEGEGLNVSLPKSIMLILAVTLHNIPEGMAIGVVVAAWLDTSQITFNAALALSIGIAIQNFPEGAIISMPLHADGQSKFRAFIGGVLSGIVEPVGAVITIISADLIVPILPYLLSAAAGAMMYVVVEELIPEMSAGEHSNLGVISFAVGFTLMLALDTALS